jgi:HEPN domain-containing protein
MSYTLEDAMRDEAYEAMSRELYPDHRAQAIEEFTSERLQSYYLQNPDVAVKGALSFKEAKALLKNGHASACIVFAVAAVEQFLKAALLRPVVFGLIHMKSLADLIVEVATDQNGGLDRYKKLLAGLFKALADIELSSVRRDFAQRPLLEEVKALQDKRNAIVHRGEQATTVEAEQALAVANAVFSEVFVQLLASLGLRVVKGGHIVAA